MEVCVCTLKLNWSNHLILMSPIRTIIQVSVMILYLCPSEKLKGNPLQARKKETDTRKQVNKREIEKKSARLLVCCWQQGWGFKYWGHCYLLLLLINTIVCLPFTQLTDVLIWVFLLSSAISNETRTPDTLSISELQRPFLTEETRKHHTNHTRGEREQESESDRERKKK